MSATPDMPKYARYSDVDYARIVYFLYFAGFFMPVAALAGVILAYVKRDDAGPLAASHYAWQIRSFWIGLGAVLIGGILSIILIGWAVIALWTVWALVRFITGFLKLNDDAAVQDPESWGFTA